MAAEHTEKEIKKLKEAIEFLKKGQHTVTNIAIRNTSKDLKLSKQNVEKAYKEDDKKRISLIWK